MSAITPSSIYTENAGSLRRTVAVFDTVSTLDSWASGIQGIVYISANQTSALNTVTNYGMGITWTASNGTILFRSSTETSTNLYVNVLSKS